MKIGIFSLGAGYKDASGTGTFLLEMMRRIASEHEVHFITSGSGPLRPELSELDVQVKTFKSIRKTEKISSLGGSVGIKPAEIEMLSTFPNYYELKRYAERELDILSTHYYLDNLILSNLIDVPTVFRFPGIRSPSIRWRAMAQLADSTVYLANSESTARRVREWLDIDPSGVVYAGVDTDQFSPDAESAFHSDVPVVLYVGRLDEGKGLDDLLRAFKRLNTEAELHIVGDGALKSNLETTAYELGIDDSVVFSGAIPHSEIHRYYAGADVFCLPSYHEGFPVVNMEAMSSGLAVVSTTIEAVQDQIDNGEHGLLVNPGDVPALADALSRSLSDPELRNCLGTAARQRANEQFTWEIQATCMIDYYAEAVSKY